MMDLYRKKIRLTPNNYLGRGCYFLTMCTFERTPLFRDAAALVATVLEWLRKSADEEKFEVSAYCFMPDHLHVLATGKDEGCDLLRFAHKFKWNSGLNFYHTNRLRLWQKKYYDHILRKEDEWSHVAWYIWFNPVRKQLCVTPHEWPFSGSLTLDWRQLVGPEKMWRPPWKNPGCPAQGRALQSA